MSIKYLKRNKKKCIVVFSAYQLKHKGSFTFYNNFVEYNDFDFIFLADETSCWYNYHFEGINGNNVKSIFESLNFLLREYDETFLIGPSMGGYASLLYSELNNVSQIMAISPQIFLKENYPRYNQSNLNGRDIQDVSLINKEKFFIDNSLIYVIGLDDLYDLYQALIFFGDGLKLMEYVTLVENSYHNVAYFYHKRNILNRFFESFVQKKLRPGMSPYEDMYLIDSSIKSLIISNDFKILLEKFYDAYFFDKLDVLLDIARRLVKMNPNWLGLQRLYGLALFKLSKYDECFNVLELVSKSNFIDDIYYELCISCFYLGKYDEMVIFLQRSFKINLGVTGKVLNELLLLLSGHDNIEIKDKYSKILKDSCSN